MLKGCKYLQSLKNTQRSCIRERPGSSSSWSDDLLLHFEQKQTHFAYRVEKDPSFVRFLLGRLPEQSLQACVQKVVTLIYARVGADFFQLAAFNLEDKT